MESCLAEEHWPTGIWPSRSEMAKCLPSRMFDQAMCEILFLLHDTENKLYSHAVSDLGVVSAFDGDPNFTLELVPQTTQLSDIASRHAMPVIAALLLETMQLSKDITDEEPDAAYTEAFDKAVKWMVSHPAEVLKKG